MKNVFLYSLVAGMLLAQAAQADPRSIDEGKQQILFESLLYDGGTGPDLQEKHPTAAPIATAPRPASPPPAQPRPLAVQPNYQYRIVPATASYTAPPAAAPAQPLAQYAPRPPVAVPPSPPQAAVAAPPPPSNNDIYRRAQAGDAEAEYQLGMMFAQDRTQGRAQNAARSFRLFSQAASQGHKRAQYNLGVMHAQGQGTVQNLIEAYVWFNLSAAQQMEGATEARDMVAASLTPEALMKAQESSSLYQARINQNLAQVGNASPTAPATPAAPPAPTLH